MSPRLYCVRTTKGMGKFLKKMFGPSSVVQCEDCGILSRTQQGFNEHIYRAGQRE